MWDTLIISPMVNSLLFLYQLLFHNFALAITVFTILIRLLTFPLTYQQQKASKKLMELQKSDEWKKIQEKHKGDREQLAQEQMKLYQRAGVNPLGGCLPTVIQFPVLIGLYQAITIVMAATPVQLLNLSQHIYPFFKVADLIPLQNQWLWLHLGLPDPYYILPLLVVVTTWIQSKVMTPATGSADPQAAQMSQTMAVYMPLMIGWMSLQFPSGLSVYWVISNVIGVVQYALTTPINWREVLSFKFSLTPPAQPAKGEKPKKKK